MLHAYILVFLITFLFDVVPLPLPPAFTAMIFLQIYFNLDVWTVIVVGVAGSVTGRYILTLYIPRLAGALFNPTKNEDVRFLGEKLKTKGWKSHLAIFTYSLLPLPTTPLFIAGGMAKMKPYYIIPGFIAGKFISDSITVFAGKYTTENMPELLSGTLSWKSISSLLLGFLLIFALLFIDWRTMLEQKKFRLKFNIWK
jgi:membrane protein YqaA with SNARE-associated domain